MEKECSKHGVTKHSQRSDGRLRCNACAVEYVTNKRIRLKEKAVQYKGGKCQYCGYDKYIGALEFHHLDPSQKDFTFGNKGYIRSWEKMKIELDKCILLCANCHREEHNK